MKFDTKTQKVRKSVVILIIVTIIYMFFIWIHSAMPADVSAQESLTVLDCFDVIFKSLGFSIELTDHIVRKTAHFCEFALLGLLVLWTANKINNKIAVNLLSCGFICLATAIVDETIQLFSPGRAGMIVDVVLDFSGICFGFLFFVIVYNIFLYIKGKKRSNSDE